MGGCFLYYNSIIMHSFEILPHTADLRLKMSGDSLDELFRAAMEGMAQIQKPEISEFEIKNQNVPRPKKPGSRSQSDLGKKLKIRVEVKSGDSTSLLIDFLSEILTQSQINKAVFNEVVFSKLTETELEAEIFGYKVDEFNEDIKAVTYHEADVKKNEKGQLETVIIFDI